MIEQLEKDRRGLRKVKFVKCVDLTLPFTSYNQAWVKIIYSDKME